MRTAPDLNTTRQSPRLGGEGEGALSLELSDEQVESVRSAALSAGNLSLLFARSSSPRTRTDAVLNADWHRLSGSLLTGLLLYTLLPTDGSAIGIAELARLTGMKRATVHRYITTLAVVRLAIRDPRTRRYRAAED